MCISNPLSGIGLASKATGLKPMQMLSPGLALAGVFGRKKKPKPMSEGGY